MEEKLENLSYAQLRTLAKKLNVKAKGKKIELIKKIENAQKKILNEESAADEKNKSELEMDKSELEMDKSELEMDKSAEKDMSTEKDSDTEKKELDIVKDSDTAEEKTDLGTISDTTKKDNQTGEHMEIEKDTENVETMETVKDMETGKDVVTAKEMETVDPVVESVVHEGEVSEEKVEITKVTTEVVTVVEEDDVVTEVDTEVSTQVNTKVSTQVDPQFGTEVNVEVGAEHSSMTEIEEQNVPARSITHEKVMDAIAEGIADTEAKEDVREVDGCCNRDDEIVLLKSNAEVGLKEEEVMEVQNELQEVVNAVVTEVEGVVTKMHEVVEKVVLEVENCVLQEEEKAQSVVKTGKAKRATTLKRKATTKGTQGAAKKPRAGATKRAKKKEDVIHIEDPDTAKKNAVKPAKRANLRSTRGKEVGQVEKEYKKPTYKPKTGPIPPCPVFSLFSPKKALPVGRRKASKPAVNYGSSDAKENDNSKNKTGSTVPNMKTEATKFLATPEHRSSVKSKDIDGNAARRKDYLSRNKQGKVSSMNKNRQI